MKKVFLLLGVFFSLSILTYGQTLLLNENFDYGTTPNADLTAASANWTRYDGTKGPTYVVPGLTYEGYPSSGIGGAAGLTYGNASSGVADGDARIALSSVISTSSDIYLSFLVNITEAKTTADYFIHFSQEDVSSNIYRARPYVIANGTGYSIHLSKSTETKLESNEVLEFGKTYLFVIKYSLILTADDDDLAYLYIYDKGIPATEPGSPLVALGPAGAGKSADPKTIGFVAFRQGTNGMTGTVDGIRVGDSWSALFQASSGDGKTIFSEDFDYPAGEQLVTHNWLLSGTSNTNPLLVTSPGLSYTNYPSIAGNAVSLTTTGQDLYRPFDSVNTGSVYLSFLFNIASAQSGDYFIALSPPVSQTNYTARVHAKASGSGYVLGIKKSNESNPPYGTTELSFNKTYLAVVKYELLSATTNDDMISLYVFADPALPSSEPTTPEIAYYTGDPTKTDASAIGFVTLRQGSSSSAAALVIDGIRVATSWGSLIGTATDVKIEDSVPSEFVLAQNYPNPFNPETVINFSLAKDGMVTLKVYNILGKEVATLVNGYRAAGSYQSRFSAMASSLPSGIYFYRIQTGQFSQTKKMMLLK